MASMQLRLTGEWPTLEQWHEYPNWENALDEESVPGQDETTLRPSHVQDAITGAVSFTAATAVLASGEEVPAILELIDLKVSGVTVLSRGRDGWRLHIDAKKCWRPFDQTWLPESKRSPVVSMSDGSVFPLKIVSRLDSVETGAKVTFTIKSNGTADVT